MTELVTELVTEHEKKKKKDKEIMAATYCKLLCQVSTTLYQCKSVDGFIDDYCHGDDIELPI